MTLIGPDKTAHSPQNRVYILDGLAFTAVMPFAIDEEAGGEVDLALEERSVELVRESSAAHESQTERKL
jgi:hypothetical protein